MPNEDNAENPPDEPTPAAPADEDAATKRRGDNSDDAPENLDEVIPSHTTQLPAVVLQSLNEELSTVNQELKSKIEELGRVNSDLRNLIISTDIATIFLDRELRIKRYTPRAAEISNLLAGDLERPLSHLRHNLEYPELAADAARVLAELTPLEREVNASGDRVFLTRVLPYRTQDGHIDGVVLTLLDITERARAEARVLASEEKYRALFESIDEGFCTIEVLFDSDGKARDYRFLEVNPAFARQTGLENAVGKTMRQLNAQHEEFWFETYGQIAKTGEAMRFEHEAAALGKCYDVYAFRVGQAEQNRVAIIFNDIFARKRAEGALRESEERYRVFIESVRDYAIFLMDARGVVTSWDSGVEEVLGYREDEFLGRDAAIIFTPEDREKGEPQKEMAQAKCEGRAPDDRWHLKKSGERFFVNGVLMALRDEVGALTGFAKILRDMTQRKHMEDELQRAHDELETRVAERTLQFKEANASLQLEVMHRRQLEQAREQLLQRLVSAQEEERRRISRELHDQLGQQLTALLMGLKSLPHIEDNGMRPPSINNRIETLEQLADDLMQRAHRLAWELRPASLDNFGLEPALRQYVKEWSEQNGIEADFMSRDVPALPRLPLDAEIALYRVAQEALANVLRHAEAKRVSVVLERGDGRVALIVEDDGCGFQTEHDENGALQPSLHRLGLLGMQERMELVRGTLQVESSPRGGTTIYARVLASENEG